MLSVTYAECYADCLNVNVVMSIVVAPARHVKVILLYTYDVRKVVWTEF